MKRPKYKDGLFLLITGGLFRITSHGTSRSYPLRNQLPELRLKGKVSKGKQGTTWHKCVIISVGNGFGAVALAKYYHVRYYTVCRIYARGRSRVEQPDPLPASLFVRLIPTKFTEEEVLHFLNAVDWNNPCIYHAYVTLALSFGSSRHKGRYQPWKVLHLGTLARNRTRL